jgi:hypothetical protein
MSASSPWTHTTQEYLHLSHVIGSRTTVIPATCPCCTPAHSRSHSLLEHQPPPPSPLPIRPCWAQATCGTTGPPFIGLLPPIRLFPPSRPCLATAPCGMTGAPPHWDRHQPGTKQLHPPACQESHF